MSNSDYSTPDKTTLDQTTFRVPSFARAEVVDFGAPNTPEYQLYQELTAISREIEACRAAKLQ